MVWLWLAIWLATMLVFKAVALDFTLRGQPVHYNAQCGDYGKRIIRGFNPWWDADHCFSGVEGRHGSDESYEYIALVSYYHCNEICEQLKENKGNFESVWGGLRTFSNYYAEGTGPVGKKSTLDSVIMCVQDRKQYCYEILRAEEHEDDMQFHSTEREDAAYIYPFPVMDDLCGDNRKLQTMYFACTDQARTTAFQDMCKKIYVEDKWHIAFHILKEKRLKNIKLPLYDWRNSYGLRRDRDIIEYCVAAKEGMCKVWNWYGDKPNVRADKEQYINGLKENYINGRKVKSMDVGFPNCELYIWKRQFDLNLMKEKCLEYRTCIANFVINSGGFLASDGKSKSINHTRGGLKEPGWEERASGYKYRKPYPYNKEKIYTTVDPLHPTVPFWIWFNGRIEQLNDGVGLSHKKEYKRLIKDEQTDCFNPFRKHIKWDNARTHVYDGSHLQRIIQTKQDWYTWSSKGANIGMCTRTEKPYSKLNITIAFDPSFNMWFNLSNTRDNVTGYMSLSVCIENPNIKFSFCEDRLLNVTEYSLERRHKPFNTEFITSISKMVEEGPKKGYFKAQQCYIESVTGDECQKYLRKDTSIDKRELIESVRIAFGFDYLEVEDYFLPTDTQAKTCFKHMECKLVDGFCNKAPSIKDAMQNFTIAYTASPQMSYCCATDKIKLRSCVNSSPMKKDKLETYLQTKVRKAGKLIRSIAINKSGWAWMLSPKYVVEECTIASGCVTDSPQHCTKAMQQCMLDEHSGSGSPLMLISDQQARTCFEAKNCHWKEGYCETAEEIDTANQTFTVGFNVESKSSYCCFTDHIRLSSSCFETERRTKDMKWFLQSRINSNSYSDVIRKMRYESSWWPGNNKFVIQLCRHYTTVGNCKMK